MSAQSPHSHIPIEDDCERLHDLIPAYALGATDADETAFVAAALPQCPHERAELQAYLGVANALLHSIPPAAPPAHLHDRLMDAIRADNRTAAEPPPVHSSPIPLFRPPPNAPVRHAPPAAATRAPSRSSWWVWIAAAAMVLLAATNLYWFSQLSSLRESQAQGDRTDVVLASILSNDVQRVALAGDGTDAAATVYWSPANDKAVLVSDRLPALAAGRTYQLWLIEDNTPVSAGVFAVDPEGRTTYIFESSRALDTLDALGISNEPAGGSSAPTSTPLLVGTV